MKFIQTFALILATSALAHASGPLTKAQEKIARAQIKAQLPVGSKAARITFYKNSNGATNASVKTRSGLTFTAVVGANGVSVPP